MLLYSKPIAYEGHAECNECASRIVYTDGFFHCSICCFDLCFKCFLKGNRDKYLSTCKARERFECPLKCSQNEKFRVECLKKHLEHRCLKIKMKCPDCGMSQTREESE